LFVFAFLARQVYSHSVHEVDVFGHSNTAKDDGDGDDGSVAGDKLDDDAGDADMAQGGADGAGAAAGAGTAGGGGGGGAGAAGAGTEHVRSKSASTQFPVALDIRRTQLWRRWQNELHKLVPAVVHGVLNGAASGQLSPEHFEPSTPVNSDVDVNIGLHLDDFDGVTYLAEDRSGAGWILSGLKSQVRRVVALAFALTPSRSRRCNAWCP
jgi:hypothetical protein